MLSSAATADSILETVRRRFEDARRQGSRDSLEKFLPDRSEPRYLPTLEELVHIDLEFGWKTQAPGQRASDETTETPPLVEAYLARFPDLNQPPVVLRLLRQEFRMRQKYGDQPSHDSYRLRFPELVKDGTEIGSPETFAPPPEGAAPRFTCAGSP